MPGAGLLYTAARVGGRTAASAVSWSSGHPGRRGVLGLSGAAGLALAAFSWWPNGEYRPVQPGERGTLTGVVSQVAALPTGRPSLTPQRQRQLGGAPTQLQRSTSQASDQGLGVPDTTSTTDTTTSTTGTTTTPATGTTTPGGQTQTVPGTGTTPTTPATTTPATTTPAPTTPGPTATTTTSTTPMP